MYCSKCSLRNPIQRLIFWNAIFNDIQILCLGFLWSYVTRFLALGTLHVFLRLAPVAHTGQLVARFSAVGTYRLLSRVWQTVWNPLKVFPRLAPTERFPAFCTHWTFSRALHPLNVFPRLATAVCFTPSAYWFIALIAFTVISQIHLTSQKKTFLCNC